MNNGIESNRCSLVEKAIREGRGKTTDGLGTREPIPHAPKKPSKSGGWTAEEIDRLLKLWKLGKSDSEIGQEEAFSVEFCAVCDALGNSLWESWTSDPRKLANVFA